MNWLKWGGLAICAIAAAFFIFLNRSGIELKDLQALQSFMLQEREKSLLAQLKAVEKVYSDENTSFMQQQKKLREIEQKLSAAEKIEIRQPLVKKKKSLKVAVNISFNSGITEEILKLRRELSDLQSRKSRKLREYGEIKQKFANLEIAYEKYEDYRQHRHDHEYIQRKFRKKIPQKISYFDYKNHRGVLEDQLAAARKALLNIENLISIKQGRIQEKENACKMAEEQNQQQLRRNEDLRQKNRAIDEKNRQNELMYQQTLRDKKHLIAELKQLLENAKAQARSHQQKMTGLAAAEAKIKAGLTPEQKEISTKVAFIKAHIYCEALDGGRNARKFLEALQKSEAKSWEAFHIYLKINDPSLYETTRDRKFRKKRAADLAALQLDLEKDSICYTNKENIELAYQLIRKKY